MCRVFSTLYTLDSRFVLSGSDDSNLRIWKARAAEKLGTMDKREMARKEYRDGLREKWGGVADVAKLERYLFVTQVEIKLVADGRLCADNDSFPSLFTTPRTCVARFSLLATRKSRIDELTPPRASMQRSSSRSRSASVPSFVSKASLLLLFAMYFVLFSAQVACERKIANIYSPRVTFRLALRTTLRIFERPSPSSPSSTFSSSLLLRFSRPAPYCPFSALALIRFLSSFF